MATGESKGPGGDIAVRRIRADEGDLLRVIRLAALEDSPNAFGETSEHARLSDWNARAIEGAAFFDRALFVAVLGARPIGMVFVKCASPPDPASLQGMWVNADFRRRGVGRSLVDHGVAFLRTAGQTELALWVTRGHHEAFDFYRSIGFRGTGASEALRSGSDLLIDELRFVIA
jgi:ribosomal protein S18 acetylase RimI-like enzyme